MSPVAMKNHFKELILKVTHAESMQVSECIQELWSGYGQILRIKLTGGLHEQVVVKHVKWSIDSMHPRGWDTNFSHQRKLKSYEVETAWYQHWSNQCEDSRIPNCLAVEHHDDEVLIVMEDLDQAGFPLRKTSVSLDEMKVCLRWLANFHGTFINEKPKELWTKGTYWHLDTRPDEWAALTDLELKQSAQQIDEILTNNPYQTIVHGDAKLANFCFSNDGKQVAGVDFQYVGGGCGMKDVVYFIGSCLHEQECEQHETALLDCYFTTLSTAVNKHKSQLNPKKIESEWRKMYPVAWTDFHRFLKGWSPGHWKINTYSEKLARAVLTNLSSL